MGPPDLVQKQTCRVGSGHCVVNTVKVVSLHERGRHDSRTCCVRRVTSSIGRPATRVKIYIEKKTSNHGYIIQGQTAEINGKTVNTYPYPSTQEGRRFGAAFKLCTCVTFEKRVFVDIAPTCERSEPPQAQRAVVRGSTTKRRIHERCRGLLLEYVYLQYLDWATCELEAIHSGQGVVSPLHVQVLYEAEALVSPRGRVVRHVHQLQRSERRKNGAGDGQGVGVWYYSSLIA